ncbi:MAG: hypothetical protein IKT87_07785 [Bacteroidaceae bacterium]|nr:hypothetical protein [Bacteroidaceae bacterium]
MKKFFIFYMTALVAMCGLNSCSDDCNHNFIEHDYSQELVGTWTCFDPEKDFSEALAIKADGSMEITGVRGSDYYETKGIIRVENNKVTYAHENGEKVEGRFEMVAGESFSMIFDEEPALRYTYHYCANDLSDEIVGMWITPSDGESWMVTEVFHDNGKTDYSFGYPLDEDEANDYKVVGDLLFYVFPDGIIEGWESYAYAYRLAYTPATAGLSDMMTMTTYLGMDNEIIVGSTSSYRVKQNLSLAEKSYDYSNLYLTDVKGKDQDINFWGYTMNLANMDGSGIDKMLKSILFHIEFPDANTLSYTYSLGTNKETYSAPIEVEGNKFTVKMSQRVPTLKDVVFYAFQSADDSQMHLYLNRDAFVNFYTNMQAMLMIVENPQFDITDAVAIDAIYNNISDAVESINLGIIMK